MKFRLANPADSRALAELHYAGVKNVPASIFGLLGRGFLRKYYEVVLAECDCLIVCAEDETGALVGFVSAALSAEKQFARLRRRRLSLGLASIGAVLRNPRCLGALIARYRSTTSTGYGRYVYTGSEARSEYWVWDPNRKDPLNPIRLYQSHLAILRALGVTRVYLEVDLYNKPILEFHKRNGATLSETVALPDSRQRAIMYYSLGQIKIQ